MTKITKQTWDQQTEETDQKYTWFEIYKNMGPKRSIEKVAKKIGKNKKTVTKISSKNQWVKRVQDYDNYKNKQLAKKYENQWKKFNHTAFTNTIKEEGALNHLFQSTMETIPCR